MVDLSVDFLGYSFKNPFWLSSAPPTRDADHVKRAVKEGWGGAVLKTIGPDKIIRPDVRPRFAATKLMTEIFSFQNIELITDKKLIWWDQQIRMLKELKIPIIASIMAGPDEADWEYISKWAEEHGADILEMNVSCPHGEPEIKAGAFIGQHPELIERYTKSVVNSVGCPVIVKLTPNVTDIVPCAEAALNGGAKAVTAINTVLGINGVDIIRAIPHPNVEGYSTPGGHSGPAVKHIGLRMVAQIAKSLGDKLLISGCGGISSWENSVEYIMLGAISTQTCTAVMIHGYEIVKRWIVELERFIVAHDYETITDMKGKALEHIKPLQELRVVPGIIAQVDTERCTDCGLCIIACKDGAASAMKEPAKNYVDADACIGCSLCRMVCPVNAIKMVNIG